MTDRTTPRKTNDSSIARIRMERGLTQAQLADMVGCYTKDISRWETGKHKPSIAAMLKIARALGCQIEDLI